MVWLNPVYDRTLSDVSSLKQLSSEITALGWANTPIQKRVEWMLGETVNLFVVDGKLKTVDGLNLKVGTGRIKGSINPIDLNRIQNNIVFLRDWLASDYGVNVVINETNPTWNRVTIPLISNVNIIRDNVNGLLNSGYKYMSTPVIRYSNPVNWSDANDIEKCLFDLYTILSQIPLSWKNCGTFNCGQGVIL
jgi:hypothetical protein